MAKELENSAEDEPANKELVMQLIEEAQSDCFRFASVKISARGSDGKTREYVGTVAEIDYHEEMIKINEAQAVEGVPMGDIAKYEWL